jgi:hypothetical protein
VITEVDGSRPIEYDGEIPDRLLIVKNDALESLLLDRNVAGIEFKRRCREASKAFVRHLADDLQSRETSELVILSKGVAYQLSDAVEHELSLNLPMNLISTTRAAVVGDRVSIEVTYQRFDAGGSHLLIGDTVASGATIVAALEAYGSVHDLVSVSLVSYAGSVVGAQRIATYCAQHGIALNMIFGLAAFGLGENGFDLSFLHPDSITEQAYRDWAARQFDGKPVSAVGWDFGTQYVAPKKYGYLCWAEARHWGLVGHPSLSLAQEPPDLDVLANEQAAFSSSPVQD